MTTHYTDFEVNLNGLTFIVSGTYTPGMPATGLNPADGAMFEVDESRLKVKGQPEADPLILLEEMRGSLRLRGLPDKTFRIDWDSGFEQLADRCLFIASDGHGIY